MTVYRDRKAAIFRKEKLPPTRGNQSVTLEQLAQDAIDWYASRGRKSLQSFSSLASTIRKSPLGKRVAEDIDHMTIEQWIAENKNWSPATRNRYKSCFSKIYSLCMKNRGLTVNPARLIDRFGEDNERARWLTDEEERKLRKIISEKHPKQLPAFLFAINTGVFSG